MEISEENTSVSYMIKNGLSQYKIVKLYNKSKFAFIFPLFSSHICQLLKAFLKRASAFLSPVLKLIHNGIT